MAKEHKIGGRGKNQLSLKKARKLVRENTKKQANKTLPYSGYIPIKIKNKYMLPPIPPNALEVRDVKSPYEA